MAGKSKSSFKNRMFIMLLLIFIFGFMLVIGRLFILHIFNGSDYAERALKQQFSSTTISPNRGMIYDRNMVPLAESVSVWDVIASPSSIKSEDQRNSIADELAKILKLDRQTIYNQLNKTTSYEVIAKKVDKATADQITAYKKGKGIGSIGLLQDSKRSYPFGNFASQLLGFTGADNQGLSGVEAQYDSVLKGVPGRMLSAKNAHGTEIPTDFSDYIPAQDGHNLVLTIDEVVQHYLETELLKAVNENHVTSKATGIVMNVNTGEILGMATEPSFDANNPFAIADQQVSASLAPLSGDALKQATNNAQQAQWRNKAISDPYEPGSVFKVLVAAAGLEESKVHENETFRDPGQITIGDRTFHDWNKQDNGIVTFIQAFEQSWNVVFAEIGERLGSKSFYDYFSGFGLTAKSGIDLPGEANSIYHTEKDLGPVELASSSFGQSFKVTAVQLISAVAAASNGGYLVQPHVVKGETDQNGNVVKVYDTPVKRQVVSAETSKEIDKLLGLEVNEGSGKNAYVAGYRVGGKTGTAQKLDDPTDPNGLVASFAGVAPTDNPQIAVLVILDNPHNPISNYGSVIAAPVAGRIFSQILPYLGVEPKYTDSELQTLEIKTPNLSGKNITDAKNILSGAKLKYSVKGNGQTVTGQMPADGSGIQKNGTVVIYTGNTPAQNTTVPDLINLSPEQVAGRISSAGLNVKYMGLAQDSTDETAYSQSVGNGTSVPLGTVITVNFRDNKLSVN